MFNLINDDNMNVEIENESINLLFADYVYENLDFSWADKYWKLLAPNSVFIGMTDYHSDSEFDIYMKSLGAKRINKLVFYNEWGNHPKDRFHECYDSIYIYTNGKHKFDGSKIQVPKKTLTTGLNPSGRMTKQATAWIDDCVLTTTSNERVKKDDGHLIRWQKSEKLLRRIFSPFVKPGDLIVDCFMGSGTSAVIAKELECNYIGIEYDKEPFELAVKRIYGE